MFRVYMTWPEGYSSSIGAFETREQAERWINAAKIVNADSRKSFQVIEEEV